MFNSNPHPVSFHFWETSLFTPIHDSLVESCTANKVNPLTYLTYVLANARNKSITLPTPDEFTASDIAHVG